jgi:C4-dicarboxylate-specific signal transduction histidine kinase
MRESPLLEKRILDRVVLISILTIAVYAIIQTAERIVDGATDDFSDIIFTLGVLMSYASYYALLRLEITFTVAKVWIYTVFHLSIIGAFFNINGLYGLVPADIVSLLVVGYFLFSSNKSRIVITTLIVVTIVLLILIQVKHPELIKNTIIISPTFTIVFGIASRFLLALNYTSVIWQEYQRERNQITSRNEEIADLNTQLQSSNANLQEVNVQLSNKISELHQAQEQLVQSEKMTSLGLLTAGVAHEINNPLNFIKGAHFGLSRYFEEHKSQNEEVTRELLACLEEGFERTSSIVKVLAQFSSQGSHSFKEVDIIEVIYDSLVILQNRYEDRIKIERNFDKEHFEVFGDSSQLHQLIISILTNSIQAIPGKGHILIDARIVQKNIQIRVKDTGKGMDQTTLDRAMYPFFTTKDPGEGTGLGLSMSYSIVKEHRGTLQIFSEQGIGTEVVIELPEAGVFG